MSVVALAQPFEVEPYRYDGIYRPEMAARYLRVGLPAGLQRIAPPSRQRLTGWIKSGLIHARPRVGPGGHWIMNFDDLVTAQAIVLFFEAGHSIQFIRRFERVCAHEFKVDRPYAREEFWYASRDILARLAENTYLSARHPRQLTFDNDGMDRLSDRLRFVDHRPDSWLPWDRVELRPDTQFGRPCVKGTRITTSTLWGFVTAGEPPDSLAEEYNLSEEEVRDAVLFEQAVRAPVAAAVPVSG